MHTVHIPTSSFCRFLQNALTALLKSLRASSLDEHCGDVYDSEPRPCVCDAPEGFHSVNDGEPRTRYHLVEPCD